MNGRHLFINPLVVFLGTWGVVFYLYNLCLSDVLSPLSDQFVYAAVGLMIFSACCFFVGAIIPSRGHKPTIPIDELSKVSLIKTVHRLFLIMVGLFVVTVVTYQGFPLLWIILGDARTYTEFGFPTIHGFFNSLLLITGTIAFWLLLNNQSKDGSKIILAFCIIVPIITLHRQSMVSLLLQCLFIFAAVRHGSAIQSARGVVIFLLTCSALFAVLGNIRTGDEALAGQASLLGAGQELPLPVLWLYMYLTTPLSNFYDLTIMSFEPTYGGSSLAGLTPTVVRQVLWGEPSQVMDYFSERTFNSSSYAFILFLDFGWRGVYFFTGCVIGYGGVLYNRFVRYPTLYNLLNLSILNHVVFLFVFANFMLTWGILFQFVIVRLLRRKLMRIGGTPKLLKSSVPGC